MKSMLRLTFFFIFMSLLFFGCASNQYYDEAKYFLEQRQYDAALSQLRLAVAEEPLRVEIRNKYADVLKIKKNEIGSLVQYVAVLKIDPNNSYAKRAIKNYVDKNIKKLNALINEDKWHEAYDLWENLMDLDKENKKLYAMIGKVKALLIKEGNKYFEKDDLVNAAAIFYNAITLEDFELNKKSAMDEELIKRFNTIREVYKKKAKKIEVADTYAAIGDYQRALSVDPYNRKLHFKVGKLYGFFTEFHYEAYNAFKKAIVNGPEVSMYHLHLGELYYIKGNFDMAKKEILQGMSLLEKEVSQDVYNKKPYKYFYSSVNPFKRMVKGLKKDNKDKELYIQLEKDDRIVLNLSKENIEYLKTAIEISKQWDPLLYTIRTSNFSDDEKLKTANLVHSFHDLIREEDENEKKERELFASLIEKFNEIGPKAVDDLNRLGTLCGLASIQK